MHLLNDNKNTTSVINYSSVLDCDNLNGRKIMVKDYLDRSNEPARDVLHTQPAKTTKWYYSGIPVILVVLVIIFVVVIKWLKLRRRKLRQKPVNTVYVLPDPPVKTPNFARISRPVYKNQQSPVYLVPFSALPANFDYTSPEIKVRGDYVILKDLACLEDPGSAPTEMRRPEYLEAYQKQAPYNPAYY